MTTYTVEYLNGGYAITSGAHTDICANYHAAEQIIASITEAEHSWVMGGDALLIEAGRFAARGRAEQWESGERTYDTEPTFASRYIAPMYEEPLLAQCAALLDSLLGGPVANGGIVDEVRRVRAALAKEGW